MAVPAHWLWRFSPSPGAGRSIASQSPPAMRNMAPAPWAKLNAPGSSTPFRWRMRRRPSEATIQTGWRPTWSARSASDAAVEGSALAERAPIDLRVNRLKSDVGRTTAALAAFHPAVSEMLPDALRIAPPAAAERAAPVEGRAGVRKGLVRGPGSGLADRRGGGRRNRSSAGAGFLRRRRRQDPGARRRDGQHRPTLGL